MSRYAYEQHTRVHWVTTIAAIASPTVAEINAGTNLSPFLKKDGVKIGMSQNNVDNATIESAFDAQVVGSWGVAPELTMFRDAVGADDDAWTLTVYGTVGFLVVRRGPDNSVAFAAAQRAEVYPGMMHEPINSDSAANENTTFTVKIAVTSEPEQKAVVT